MYQAYQQNFLDSIAHVKNNIVKDPHGERVLSGRMILKGGMVVDPYNQIEMEKDIAIIADEIVEVADVIPEEKGDVIIPCDGLLVVPGLIDAHLHLGDLFETSVQPIFEAAQDGVTMAFSPGAGNTFMAPSLLAAEVDRGIPLNIGLLLGAPNILGTMLDVEELIALFKGELAEETAAQKMTRNVFAYLNSPFIIGLKDHMGHYIMPDEKIDAIYEITSGANLMFMSHTQCPEHATRIVELSKGRKLHLAHATAPGGGTHGDPVNAMKTVMELCKLENVSAEFVTSMLRQGLGNRDGLLMTKASQQVAYDALEAGVVKILNSDGQSAATMKGFGDTRDNIPALLEIVEAGILSLPDSIATMTANVAELMTQITKNPWWSEKVGHLGVGALANVTIIDRRDKMATYTIVNGNLVAFENRIIRSGNGAGRLVSKFGTLRNLGIGHLPMYSYKND